MTSAPPRIDVPVSSRRTVMIVFVIAVLSTSWQMARYATAGMGRYFESVAVARSLAAGQGFANPFGALSTGPTAHTAPLFPLILSVILRVTGDTPAFTLATVSVCVLLHGLHALFLLKLSRLFFGDIRPGLWAAVYSSLIPTLPMFPQWDVIWVAVGSMGFCLASDWILRSGRPLSLRGAASGALCGVLLLFNPAQLIVCAAWMAYLAFSRRMSIRQVGLLALSFAFATALVLTPWTIRNYREFHGFFLVRDNFGTELYSSNADCAGARDQINATNGCHELLQANLNAQEARLVRDMGEVNYNRSRLAIAKKWIQDHPARFAELTVQRFKEFWFPSPGDPGPYCYSVWLVTALSFAGLIMMVRQRNSAVLALLMILLVYPAVYYLVQTGPRFRLPILWLSLLPAGLAMHKTFSGFFHART